MKKPAYIEQYIVFHPTKGKIGSVFTSVEEAENAARKHNAFVKSCPIKINYTKTQVL